MRNLLKCTALAATFFVALAGGALAKSVSWMNATGGTVFLNSSHFDTASITFNGIHANQLSSIEGPGYYHTHGKDNITFSMSILLDGTWTQIWSDTRSGPNQNVLLSSISQPLTFALGTVTGLRLDLSGDRLSYGYHDMGGTRFIFADTTPTPLPLPAAGWMLIAAVGGLGALRARSRA